MDFIHYFVRRKNLPGFLFALVVFFSLFNDISANCMDFNIPENSEEIRVKSDIGRQGYVNIKPGNTFDYIAFQPVVSNLFTTKSSDSVLKVTKKNLLEANKFSKNQEDYEIYYFIHKHSRIVHKSEYTIAAHTGQSQFDISFKLLWLNGAVRTLNLNIKGGAEISFNCRTPKSVKVNDSIKPFSSTNYKNKTGIETRNHKDVSDISETLLPKSLSPTLKNKTVNSTLGNESGDFLSSKFQFIIHGFGILFLVFSMIILLIFIYLKRSKKITNNNKVCTDEFKTVYAASKTTANEYQTRNLCSTSDKNTSESKSSYSKPNEYEMENEYELPPLHFDLSSQKESENEYCNEMIKNNDYLEMNAVRKHK